jgi:penicillin-binding protein 1A
MKKITGGSLPAQLWHDYMTEAEADKPVRGLGGDNTLWGSTAAATDDLSKAFTNFIHNVIGGGPEQPDYPASH